LVSYGSLVRYLDFERVSVIADSTMMACSSDIADYQLLKRRIEEQTHTDGLLSDGFTLSPRALHSWITRVLYNHRCPFKIYQLAIVTPKGAEIRGPLQFEINWEIAEYVAGYE
uniref:Pup--protein ligase n=1 Tax=Echinostoma caproni TaxID=27848 RepID=A0A183AFR0_9TREM